MKAMTTDEARAKIASLRELRSKVDAELASLARLIARQERPRITRRPRRVIPPCGTETAYQRHRHYGEPQDEACRLAHNEHTAEKYRERRDRLNQITEGAA